MGITPESDNDGCMQDMHWSMGVFGYFPTYTLGNLYAGCLHKQMQKEIDLDEKIKVKDFETIKNWLKTNIHQHGRQYTSNDLIEKITGKKPIAQPYLDYLEKKFSQIYLY